MVSIFFLFHIFSPWNLGNMGKKTHRPQTVRLSLESVHCVIGASWWITWRDLCFIVDLGHCWSGAIPESGRSILPRCGLLRAGIWCDHGQHLQNPGQLARRVPHPGQPTWPRKLSICRHRQQNWFRKQSCKSLLFIDVRQSFLVTFIQRFLWN